MPFDLRGSITSWEIPNICLLGWHFLHIRRLEYKVSCGLTSGTFFLITVLSEGRQIWGRDQGPFWQAEGGNVMNVLSRATWIVNKFVFVEQLRAFSFHSCDDPCQEYSEVAPEFPAVLASTPPCRDWQVVPNPFWFPFSRFPCGNLKHPNVDRNKLNHCRLRLGLSLQRGQ